MCSEDDKKTRRTTCGPDSEDVEHQMLATLCTTTLATNLQLPRYVVFLLLIRQHTTNDSVPLWPGYSILCPCGWRFVKIGFRLANKSHCQFHINAYLTGTIDLLHLLLLLLAPPHWWLLFYFLCQSLLTRLICEREASSKVLFRLSKIGMRRLDEMRAPWILFGGGFSRMFSNKSPSLSNTCCPRSWSYSYPTAVYFEIITQNRCLMVVEDKF